ncbi:MAG TPA: hypothetical protein P5056_01875 [Candidatus Paceibacterota bacterium]|nr:hypothetical protein [Candidatus Paceibacterota bacterium]
MALQYVRIVKFSEYPTRYRAYLSSNPKVWAEGSTPDDALGRLVKLNPNIFHIRISE